ncbi:MAG: hypothetical protein ACXVC7_14930, partial [Bacteroidia bacterium]
MFDWDRSLKNYLDEFSALDARMGDDDQSKLELKTDIDNKRLMQIIDKDKPLANILLIVIFIMYVLLFLAGITFVAINPMSMPTENLALLVGG